MNEQADVRIDFEAVQALVHWKALFADEVASCAKRLAAESDQPARVTLAHYRQAAQIAISSLATAVRTEGHCNGDQKAA